MARTVRRAAVLTIAIALAVGLGSLRPASATEAVERAQRRLNELGCDAGPASGSVGPRTRSAVVRFQSRHGLVQSGRLVRTTRQRLYADSAQRCDVRPVPSGSGRGRRIVVSQGQNWVWLVAADGSTAAQGGMIDNTGILGPGRYRTGSYCGRPARVRRNTDTSGTLWLDNFVRFAPCGVGFHRIPRSRSTGEQIHPGWRLGTDYRESHGCIRLSHGLSLKIWNFTTSTTRVRVV